MTAAFLLALGVALAAALLARPPENRACPAAAGGRRRGADPDPLVGAGGWVAPALVLVVAAWIVWKGAQAGFRSIAISVGALVVMTAACIIPIWSVLVSFLGKDATLFSEGQTAHTRIGNLLGPLKVAQLAGIWPIGDFRLPAPSLPTTILIAVEILAAVGALWWSARRRQFGVWLYLVVALTGCAIFYLGGATPWVVAKALAIASPALLTAGLVGAGMLWERYSPEVPPMAGGAQTSAEAPAPAGRSAKQPRQDSPVGGGSRYAWILGMMATIVISGGVLWSNILTYGAVSLAPRARMAELQHIGTLVAGKGPTLMNEYEVYGDRHFLREGAPTEPAEYRPATIPTRTGAILTKSANANINSFALATLLPYRSLVLPVTPTESRPPSIYKLVYQGHYYQLWQRPEPPPSTILEQIPYGESNEKEKGYCGNSSNGPEQPVCALHPVATPDCPQLLGFAHKAAAENAHLVAYERPQTVTRYGDEVQWPGTWIHYQASHVLYPQTPGSATGIISVPNPQRYEVFLGGSFSRGLELSIDGHPLGTVKNQLPGYTPGFYRVGSMFLNAGIHKLTYTYPAASLAPGSAENTLTALSSIVLEPMEYPRPELVTVTPQEASKLCGHYLNWLEIVANT